MAVTREYLSIKELAVYSGISERSLRYYLKDPVNPIPHHRFGRGGKLIKVKRSDFDKWADSQRGDCGNLVDNIVNEVLCRKKLKR